MKDYLKYSHLGLTFFCVFAAFFAGGHYLDQACGTHPLFFFLGLALGFAAALYVLLKELNFL